eukprot:7487864-Pyramimonas_sp.AAC.1
MQDTLGSLASRAATKESERRISGKTEQEIMHLGGCIHVAMHSQRDLFERVVPGNIGWVRLGDY